MLSAGRGIGKMQDIGIGKNSMRKKFLLILVMVVLCAGLAVCFWIGRAHERRKAPAAPAIPMNDEAFAVNFPLLAATRADHETDSSGAQVVDLSKQGEEFLITEGGSLILSGKMKGRIRISSEEQTVHLFLKGVEVTAKEGPAMFVESAGKVIITLVEGTENRFSDSGDYRQETEAEACIYSAGDLTINGGGSLAVNGFFKDGIRSRNVIKIMDGEITIRCKRSGIHGTDGIHIAGGKLDISSEKNGLRTTKSGSNGRGNLVISGGDHKIIAGRHAFLVGRGDLYIYDCSVYEKSVIGAWDVGGKTFVQSGCVQ